MVSLRGALQRARTDFNTYSDAATPEIKRIYCRAKHLATESKKALSFENTASSIATLNKLGTAANLCFTSSIYELYPALSLAAGVGACYKGCEYIQNHYQELKKTPEKVEAYWKSFDDNTTDFKKKLAFVPKTLSTFGSTALVTSADTVVRVSQAMGKAAMDAGLKEIKQMYGEAKNADLYLTIAKAAGITLVCLPTFYYLGATITNGYKTIGSACITYKILQGSYQLAKIDTKKPREATEEKLYEMSSRFKALLEKCESDSAYWTYAKKASLVAVTLLGVCALGNIGYKAVKTCYTVTGFLPLHGVPLVAAYQFTQVVFPSEDSTSKPPEKAE